VKINQIEIQPTSERGLETIRRLKLILNHKHLTDVYIPIKEDHGVIEADLLADWEFRTKTTRKDKTTVIVYLIDADGESKRHETQVYNKTTGKTKVIKEVA
jgi:hypothetical protein